MQATAPGKYRQNWQHGHDQWCGKSCELNVDWAILDAGDSRGQGVFALRDFAVGEKIMVEGSSLEAALNSPVTPGDLRALSASVSASIMALSPHADMAPEGAAEIDAAVQVKFTNNAISLGDEAGTSGLFVTIARVNHDCAGNCEHYYLEEHGMMMLVSSRSIAKGNEITFSYVNDCSSQAQRASKLLHWGIVCGCCACPVAPMPVLLAGGSSDTIPALVAEGVGLLLNQITQTDALLLAQGSRALTQKSVKRALKTGRQLLSLYDQCADAGYDQSLMLRSRTYYDMFALAVMHSSTQAAAQEYIDLSIALDLGFFGRSDLEVGRTKRGYAANLALHPYYLCQQEGRVPSHAARSGSESGGDGSGACSDGGGSHHSGGSGSSSGNAGGSVEDGGTSDEDDFPRCGGQPTAYCTAPSLSAQVTSKSEMAEVAEAADKASNAEMASKLEGGAVMLTGLLTSAACDGAVRGLLHLRDAAEMSQLFSSPTSTRAPPCGAEAVWLCGAALGRLDADDEEAAAAVRMAVATSAAGARRALAAMGYASSEVCLVGVPMASVGCETSHTERFHHGKEGSPVLNHRPRDGLVEGDAQSPLLLTTILTLSNCAATAAGDVESEAAGDVVAGSISVAPLAVFRTRSALSHPPSKRRRLEENGGASASTSGSGAPGADASTKAHDEACGVLETAFHPNAGDQILAHPSACRSLSGGRVSITMWWQRQAAEKDAPADTQAISALSTTPALLAAPLLSSAPALSAITTHEPPLVFDGILSPAACSRLCDVPPVRFGMYDRSSPPRNAHERLIESLLAQLGDASRYVEYWGRKQWQAVPAHSDVDEIPLLAPRKPGCAAPRPRFPLWAHIVYLGIEAGVAAPTMLWSDGADAAAAGSAADAAAVGATAAERRLFVVPAVQGRLLRFDGSWVHAVPKPAAEYLGAQETAADEEAAARGEHTYRHVLLFNTWPDGPPEGLEEASANELGSSEAGGEAGDEAGGNSVQAVSVASLAPLPMAEWKATSIHSAAASSVAVATPPAATPPAAVPQATTAFVARLMGGPRRRGRSERFRVDTISAPRDTLLDALHNLERPSSFGVQ